MLKKKEIEEKTESILEPIASRHGVVIYDVEYVKEAGEWYLRAYIDREGGVDIDKCVDVSHDLSDELDRLDMIEEAYTLEVSSPGLGRRLWKDRHLSYSLGEEVEATFYDPNTADRGGVLRAFDRDTVTIETDDGQQMLDRKDISSIRLKLDI